MKALNLRTKSNGHESRIIFQRKRFAVRSSRFTVRSGTSSCRNSKTRLKGVQGRDYHAGHVSLLRRSRKSPGDHGDGDRGVPDGACSEIGSYNVIKGFLNLSLIDPRSGVPFFGAGRRRALREARQRAGVTNDQYSSPNTNKPLHLGHIATTCWATRWRRSAPTTARVIKGEPRVANDRGIHIYKSMLAWKLYGGAETPSRRHEGRSPRGQILRRFTTKHYKAQVKRS